MDEIIAYRGKEISKMTKKELIQIINELACSNKILNERVLELRIKAINQGVFL